MRGISVFPRTAPFTAGLALFALLASPASALQVGVFQESAPDAGDFLSHPLGTIEVFETAGSAADFYDYRGQRHNGATPPRQNNVSQLFLVDSAVDGVFLVVLHDDFSGGGNAATRIEVQGDPDGAVRLLEDDPAPNQRDSYTGDPGDTVFTAVNGWISGFTDGYILGDLEGPVELLVEFTAAPTNIGSWIATSADLSTIALDLTVERRVLLAVPEPTTAALLAIGLAGLAASRRSRGCGHRLRPG